MTLKSRTGGQLIVDQLLVHGVTDVFCVPGESYLAVLDALHDADVRITICRQEAGASIAAEAVGKLTGKPGICMVTRGPGATNAAHGIHVAMQDSTPLIMFVGQIETGMRERDAFQELDYRKVFSGLAKWATEIDDPARIPELISRAFHVAASGRPGPVVIALPEDMLVAAAMVPDAPPFRQVETHPGLTAMAELQKRLWAAERPIVLVGGSRWSDKAVERMIRFAERFDLPVATTFRRQALFPATHANYAGDGGLGMSAGLSKAIKEADLVLCIGDQLSEASTQSYTLLDIPGDGKRLIHVHPDPQELNRTYATALPINASPEAFTAAVEGLQPPNAIRWREWTRAINQNAVAQSAQPTRSPGDLQMSEVVIWLRNHLPEDAIITNGAGNYAIWLHRFYHFRKFGTQLAPTSGSMGYGVPAAVAAKRVLPEKQVVSFAGDGCFLMNGQEFATAVQHDLPMVIIVVDNGMYGTIRMHQERAYPGRVSATGLRNPDFAAYARAFGGHGETVRRTEEFAPAFLRCEASGKPAIIHCIVDSEAITPGKALSDIRKEAIAQGR
ncbi:MAG: thiamine pyrophosphate-binding protein [Methylocystis sp.]|nr:thiamine pyrophosphate-binding protein [Methylocystis sp.]MCA3582318.1 thiamine pyrophosphate-binding protein [Methylocystis sp.]MCA3588213.1 thiamine pyrophosphate-binding protein [Methylocystis sp.]MCA3590131.1 thiamine pyrophosphate-binding protein [Methylocystis sp.]